MIQKIKGGEKKKKYLTVYSFFKIYYLHVSRRHAHQKYFFHLLKTIIIFFKFYWTNLSSEDFGRHIITYQAFKLKNRQV